MVHTEVAVHDEATLAQMRDLSSKIDNLQLSAAHNSDQDHKSMEQQLKVTQTSNSMLHDSLKLIKGQVRK